MIESSHRSTVFTIQIPTANSGSCPQPLIELLLQLVRHETRPTERTCHLVAVHPPVQAATVKHVSAILQLPNFICGLEVIETDRAVVCLGVHMVMEHHHREDLTDQESGHGRAIVYLDVLENWFGLDEVRETHETEDRGYEGSDETKNRECLEEQLGQEDLRISDWKTHFATRNVSDD